MIPTRGFLVNQSRPTHQPTNPMQVQKPKEQKKET